MQGIIKNIEDSLYQGFIDASVVGNEQYKPELLVNDPDNHQYVLTTIIDELTNCQTFVFSVAFITESGLALFKSYLHDLKQKNIKGKILTSTYLFFNTPKVFRELLKLTNVEVRVSDLPGFHAKGYLFDHGQHHSLLFGSSNLTANALKKNYEWNVKVSSHSKGEIINKVYDNINNMWKHAHPLAETWINRYEFLYFEYQKSQHKFISEQPIISDDDAITPNKMQLAALQAIKKIREDNQERALIISATGTGKTYLSAFDVKAYAPKRLLFIVHQEQIIKKAISDFKQIIGGSNEQYGILSGNHKQYKAKYLFATVQTLSKPNVMSRFNADEFDYILIDEVHKAGAISYLNIIDYFKPDFLLGMTATPERTDSFNVFALFNYNIAYEIRLQEALAEEMLCPFHYFGVTDFEHDGQLIDDATQLTTLVSDERVKHIIEKIEYYGYCGDSVKGLIFCSRTNEAKQLSQLLNQKGYRTTALTGDDPISCRQEQIKRLENGEIEYILTVDIFNEGIDIPCLNQIVMLRQTQSSIIFIQQLGRGLRKAIDKEYVTIIDFIGNYKNNYLIPIALSGDTSQNKDNLRRKMLDPNYIQGVSTINFEQIAKERIFKSISDTKLNTARILKEAYETVKTRVGRIPRLLDFIKQHSIDPSIIALYGDNYYDFLCRMKEEIPVLSVQQQKILTMLTNEILNGKRIHELELLKILLEKKSITVSEFTRYLKSKSCYIDVQTLDSIERIFNLEFFTTLERDKYGQLPLVIKDENNIFKRSPQLYQNLITNVPGDEKQYAFFKVQLEDLIETGLMNAKQFDQSLPLKLYAKYTRKDVCRLLNWQKNEQGTIYGYAIKSNSCPIFITYHKTEEVDGSVNYQDELISTDLLLWYTRSNRTLESKEVKSIIRAEETNLAIHIFIKKDDDEGTDFYYMGQATPINGKAKQSTMTSNAGKILPVVKMQLKLRHQIDKTLYQYLTNGG